MAKESPSAPPKSCDYLFHKVLCKITTSQEHLTNFHRIRSQKPDVGLSVIGAVFLILPLIILFLSGDMLDILDMIPICCLFWLIGSVLVLINTSQTTNWNKEMNKARKEIERREKIPYPAVSQWPQIAGLFSLIGGFIAGDFDGIPFFYLLYLFSDLTQLIDQLIPTLESNHLSI